MENNKLKDFFNSDRSSMTRASIERNIATIITVYNKIPVSQHMRQIFKAGGEFMGDPFYWNDEKTLKKTELYIRFLDNNYDNEEGTFIDEPASDEFILEILSNRNKNGKV